MILTHGARICTKNENIGICIPVAIPKPKRFNEAFESYLIDAVHCIKVL